MIVLLAITAALTIILRPHSPKPSAPSVVADQATTTPAPTPSPKLTANPGQNAAVPLVTPTKEEIKQRQEKEITMAYLTPIAVYGKVVDDARNPVPDATVEIGIADKPLQTGSKYVQTTNADGLFSLTDVHGIAFSLAASKAGYYSSGKSKGHRNVVVPGDQDLPQPSATQPIILVLQKGGKATPLIFNTSRQVDVPATDQPKNIDLVTGRKGPGLQVSASLGNVDQRPFNWSFQLNVPGGGLIERKDRFDFEAPADGYQSSTEINMAETATEWSARAEKQYFARLSDGKYARLMIRFYPGKRNFVVIESYVNPTPGDRNLEFDPSTPIEP